MLSAYRYRQTSQNNQASSQHTCNASCKHTNVHALLPARSVFDADNSGSVDADEFALIIDELQAMASVERTSQDKRKE